MAVAVTGIAPTASVVANTTMASMAQEATTTLLNNLTATLISTTGGPGVALNESASTTLSPHTTNSTEWLKLPEEDDDGVHKNPELKYFSTVIIIFLGLTILIVPVFCFVGVICAKARVFSTVREVAGRGWGFRDLSVPYSEFGTEDYSKDPPKLDNAPASSRNCDVKILVADDNRVPSSRSNRQNSFIRTSASDDDEDISSLPPTFVQSHSQA